MNKAKIIAELENMRLSACGDIDSVDERD